MTDLSIGVRYQVTSLGKQSLNQTPMVVESSSEEVDPGEVAAADDLSSGNAEADTDVEGTVLEDVVVQNNAAVPVTVELEEPVIAAA